jgi:hypothetical protein
MLHDLMVKLFGDLSTGNASLTKIGIIITAASAYINQNPNDFPIILHGISGMMAYIGGALGFIGLRDAIKPKE